MNRIDTHRFATLRRPAWALLALWIGACATSALSDGPAPSPGPQLDLSVATDLSQASDQDFSVIDGETPADLSQPRDFASSGVHDMSSSTCGAINANGICNGNTLEYCSSNVLVTKDCASSGKTCQVVSGYASCK
jgi:hypothetical protein